MPCDPNQPPGSDTSGNDPVYATAADGTPLRWQVYVPGGSMPPGGWPGVLVIHGGGWSKGNRCEFAFVAELLANAGFVAATISYRLSQGGRLYACCYDRTGACATPSQAATLSPPGYTGQFADVRAALQAMRARADTGPRIGAIGSSAGAHLALWLAATGTAGDTQADAAVSWSGPSDLLEMGPAGQKAGDVTLAYAGAATFTDPADVTKLKNGSPRWNTGTGCKPVWMTGSQTEAIPLAALTSLYDYLGTLNPTPDRKLTIVPGSRHALNVVHFPGEPPQPGSIEWQDFVDWLRPRIG